MVDERARAAWNAEARHNWPGGDYIGATCQTCGVTGFFHPKRAPSYCWPDWQEAQRETEWRRAKWEADMIAEYGPHIPRARAMLSAAGGTDG